MKKKPCPSAITGKGTCGAYGARLCFGEMQWTTQFSKNMTKTVTNCSCSNYKRGKEDRHWCSCNRSVGSPCN